MKYFDWSDEKNELLKKLRGVSFEQVVLAIASGDLIDRLKHPNSKKYPNQMVLDSTAFIQEIESGHKS